MKTIYGNAEITNEGYYRITTEKEGKHGKLLHRLIFEDFYGPIPNGCVIHHKDGVKTNNCIMNLQLLTKSEHHKLHSKCENHPMFGKHHSDETRRKISEAKKCENTTGYYRVYKQKNPAYKQGFTWAYQYYEDGKHRTTSSTDIKKLEEKVRQKGLKWEAL